MAKAGTRLDATARYTSHRIIPCTPDLTTLQPYRYATILTSIAARVKNIMQALALAERHS
ncbi:hypothetical protein [Tsuneonella suprasediminis]|uniref:hypothetical protein n=1 Tax=Tsuneonella suprasediminis TaxID=2306996 RepID=UPI001402378F|nr:hypothetical protein [Tsuneonella suprasediminis]